MPDPSDNLLGTSVELKVDQSAVDVLSRRAAEADAMQAAGNLQAASNAPGAAGSRGIAYTPDNAPVDYQYSVVPAQSLITSHGLDLSVNPNFDQSLQGRDRSRAASMGQISDIAANLNPERLAASPLASEGAPIVGPDFMVESGNGRTLGIQSAYAQGLPSAQNYQQFLTQNAPQFGLDPAAVAQIENPVLVRIRQTEMDAAQRQAFAQAANVSGVSQMSEVERAQRDAQALMQSNALSVFAPDPMGNVKGPASRDFVEAFSSLVPPSERGAFMQADGEVSAPGLRQINAALLGAAYPNNDALGRMLESTDDNTRGIGTAMLGAAPSFAYMRQRVQRGELHDLDLSGDVVSASNLLAFTRKEGVPLKEYMATQGLFGEEYSPQTVDLARFFDKNKARPKRIGELLQSYAQNVERLGNPQQGSFFDEAAPSIHEVLTATRQNLEANYGETSGGGLFDVPEAAPAPNIPALSAPADDQSRFDEQALVPEQTASSETAPQSGEEVAGTVSAARPAQRRRVDALARPAARSSPAFPELASVADVSDAPEIAAFAGGATPPDPPLPPAPPSGPAGEPEDESLPGLPAPRRMGFRRPASPQTEEALQAEASRQAFAHLTGNQGRRDLATARFAQDYEAETAQRLETLRGANSTSPAQAMIDGPAGDDDLGLARLYDAENAPATTGRAFSSSYSSYRPGLTASENLTASEPAGPGTDLVPTGGPLSAGPQNWRGSAGLGEEGGELVPASNALGEGSRGWEWGQRSGRRPRPGSRPVSGWTYNKGQKWANHEDGPTWAEDEPPLDAEYAENDDIEGEFGGNYAPGLRGQFQEQFQKGLGRARANFSDPRSRHSIAFGVGFSAMAIGQGVSSMARLDAGQHVTPEQRESAEVSAFAPGLGGLVGTVAGTAIGGPAGGMVGQFAGQAVGQIGASVFGAEMERSQSIRETGETFGTSTAASTEEIKRFTEALQASGAAVREVQTAFTTLAQAGPGIGANTASGAEFMSGALGERFNPMLSSVASGLSRDPILNTLTPQLTASGGKLAPGDFAGLSVAFAAQGNWEGSQQALVGMEGSLTNPDYARDKGIMDAYNKEGFWERTKNYWAHADITDKQDAAQARLDDSDPYHPGEQPLSPSAQAARKKATQERDEVFGLYTGAASAEAQAKTGFGLAGARMALAQAQGAGDDQLDALAGNIYSAAAANAPKLRADAAGLDKYLDAHKDLSPAARLSIENSRDSEESQAFQEDVGAAQARRGRVLGRLDTEKASYSAGNLRDTLNGVSASGQQAGDDRYAVGLIHTARTAPSLSPADRDKLESEGREDRYQTDLGVFQERMRGAGIVESGAKASILEAETSGTPGGLYAARGAEWNAERRAVGVIDARLSQTLPTQERQALDAQRIPLAAQIGVEPERARQEFYSGTEATFGDDAAGNRAGLARRVSIQGSSAFTGALADDRNAVALFGADEASATPGSRAWSSARKSRRLAEENEIEDAGQAQVFRLSSAERTQESHMEHQFERSKLAPFLDGPESNPLTAGNALIGEYQRDLSRASAAFRNSTDPLAREQNAGKWRITRTKSPASSMTGSRPRLAHCRNGSSAAPAAGPAAV